MPAEVFSSSGTARNSRFAGKSPALAVSARKAIIRAIPPFMSETPLPKRYSPLSRSFLASSGRSSSPALLVSSSGEKARSFRGP